MQRIALLLALLLAGCHAHTGAISGPGTSNAAPGASGSMNLHPGRAVGTLLELGFVAAIMLGEDDYAGRAAPQLDPTRRVAEQDCSKPIGDPAANLRCK